MDAITQISETGVTGDFTFLKDSDFYKGHFKGLSGDPRGVVNGVLCPNWIGMSWESIF